MFAQRPVETMTWATAITIIVGTFASGGTQTPNWSRFSKSWQQALLAGLIAGVFAFLVGEPHVESAIALEEASAAAPEGTAAHDHDHGGAAGHAHGDEAVVSRPVQKAGLFLATGLYGLAVGGIFALVYAGLRGRVGPRNDGLLAIVAAATAFLAIVLVPFVKYPANPPAVGNPDTINERTLLYVAMVLVGLAATAVAVGTARRTGPDPWRRWTAAVAAFLVPVVAAWLLLPPVGSIAFLLLSGPTAGLPAPRNPRRRLSGGWAFLLSLPLTGAVGALLG